FLAWLHLQCGISRENCRSARDFLVQIVDSAQLLPRGTSASKLIPKDIRTSMNRLDVMPELTKQLCCQTCYTIYPPRESPTNCTYKASSASQPCGQPLFK
ncbi:hypothetical protein DFH28DRAFT_829389, partial [Melampsora americana]